MLELVTWFSWRWKSETLWILNLKKRPNFQEFITIEIGLIVAVCQLIQFYYRFSFGFTAALSSLKFCRFTKELLDHNSSIVAPLQTPLLEMGVHIPCVGLALILPKTNACLNCIPNFENILPVLILGCNPEDHQHFD